MSFFSLIGLTKYFGGLIAVNDLNIEMEEGEAHGIMGPNGAGKTTTINLISGQFKPNDGRILYMGRDITGLPPHTVRRLGIAKTYQVPQPFVNLTALENIQVAVMYGKGVGKSVARDEAKKIIDFVGLVEKKNVLSKDLEAITLKRLELARALAAEPKLLLIDEVAAGLTEPEIPAFLNILNEVRSKGITYLMIEHVLKVLLKAVDRVTVMDYGRKIAVGTPDEVMEDEKVIKAYLG